MAQTDFGWCKIPTTLSFQKNATLNPGGGLERYYAVQKPINSINDSKGKTWFVNDIRFAVTRMPHHPDGFHIIWDITNPYTKRILNCGVYYRFEPSTHTFGMTDNVTQNLMDNNDPNVCSTIIQQSTSLLNQFTDQLKRVNNW